MRTSVISLIGIVMMALVCGTICTAGNPDQHHIAPQLDATPHQSKARVAWETYQSMAEAWSPGGVSGSITREQMYVWSLRTARAEAELDTASRTEAYQRHLDRMSELHLQMQQAYKLNGVAKGEYTATQFYLMEAIQLVKEN